VSADDLSSIQGLDDKHAGVLASELQITTFRALILTDRHIIHKAMSRFRPRPTLEQIAKWQDEARSELSAPAMDPSDWHPAASFAVVFSQRHVDGAWEKQLEVERTEVEPELQPAIWPGWDCSPLCGWLLEQLGQLDGGEERVPPTRANDEDQAGFSDAHGSATRSAVIRGRLRIGSAAVIDAAGKADLIQAGELIVNPPMELVPPARVMLTITGARPGHEVCAVVRIRARGQSEWNSEDPVTTDRSGRVGLNLPQVDAGEHELKLLAWAPDATAYPVSVRLPTMTIGPTASSS
jgi:hypothetical protein